MPIIRPYSEYHFTMYFSCSETEIPLKDIYEIIMLTEMK